MADSHRPHPADASRRSGISLALALLLFGAAIGGLLLLPLLGYVGIAVMVGGLIFSLFIGFHYLIWGWWINRVVRQESDNDDEF